MPSPRSVISVALIFGAVALLQGCGGTSASPPAAATTTPRATPKPSPTALPHEVVQYADFVDPILKRSVKSAQSLLNEMSNPDYSVLANDCNDYAQTFVSQHSVVHVTFTPPGTYPVYRLTEVGYKLLLAATDECGIAADLKSSSQLNTAAGDVRKGIDQLLSAEAMMAPWRKAAA